MTKQVKIGLDAKIAVDIHRSIVASMVKKRAESVVVTIMRLNRMQRIGVTHRYEKQR